jgi:hypothetical protein
MNAAPVVSGNENWDVLGIVPSATPVMSRETSEMLMYEELARARIQELRAAALPRRSGLRIRVTGRWNREARRARNRRS